MELDTGASLSVISEDVYTQLKNIEGSSFNLQDTKLTLKSYTGKIIPVLGTLSVEVKYKDFCEHLSVMMYPTTIFTNYLTSVSIHLIPERKFHLLSTSIARI